MPHKPGHKAEPKQKDSIIRVYRKKAFNFIGMKAKEEATKQIVKRTKPKPKSKKRAKKQY